MVIHVKCFLKSGERLLTVTVASEFERHAYMKKMKDKSAFKKNSQQEKTI